MHPEKKHKTSIQEFGGLFISEMPFLILHHDKANLVYIGLKHPLKDLYIATLRVSLKHSLKNEVGVTVFLMSN